MKKIIVSLLFALWAASLVAQTTILQEGFEGNALPSAWQQEFYNTPSVSWLFGKGGYPFQSGAIDYSRTPPFAHSGSYNACFYNATNTPAQTKLILPEIDMSDKRVYKLNFWHTQGCFYNQSLAVYYKEGVSGTWKRVKQYTEILYSWQEETVTIQSSSAHVFIAFEGLWDGGCGICLDDISVNAYNSYNILFQAKDISNNPIVGATVTFSDTIKLTSSAGEALYQRIPEAAGMSLVIRKLGFRPLHANLNITKNDTITYKLPYSRILYVKNSATGLNNGKNWKDAYTSLQQALDSAYEGDQVWIAKGIYKPTKCRTAGNARTASFSLKNEVAVFGGFSGVSGTEGSTATRNITLYPSVLSGDIDNNDITDVAGVSTSISGNNAYYVVYNNDSHIDNSSILHGVYISGGRSSNQGTALYNYKVSPTISNCYFIGNECQTLDGVVFNKESSAQYISCSFSNNKNGAMTNIDASMQMLGCTFMSNTLYAVKNAQSNVYFYDCSFEKTLGVGMINIDASPRVEHSSFIANTIGMQSNSNANPDIFATTFNLNDSLAIQLDNASTKIDSCVITNNKKGAINAVDQSISNVLLLTNSTFLANGNGVHAGGALYCEGFLDAKIDNCTFRRDSALSGGAIFCRDNHAIVLTNCLFWRNGSANNGGALASDNSSPLLRHCTMASNFAQNDGGAVFSSSGTISIVNSILWGDSTATAINETSGTCNISYSIVRGIATGANNSGVDPRFIDITSGVLRLKGNSPAINAANPAIAVLVDVRGKTRPLGAAPDMGCYERDYGIEIIWAKPMDNEAIVGPVSKIVMVFDDLLKINGSGTINIYNYNTDALVHSVDVSDLTVSADTLKYSIPSPLLFEKYYFVITPDALAGINSGYTYIGTEPRDDYNFSVHRPILYVKHDAAGAKTGFTWTDAYTNLQAALDTSVNGQQIWVARGTYKPSKQWDKLSTRSQSFIPHRGVIVLGGFPGASGQEGMLTVRNPSLQKTVLSGDLDANDASAIVPSGQNAWHIIYCTARTCDTTNTFDGFTLSGGLANDAMVNKGGAVFVNKASLKLINCQITGNVSSAAGGAIFAQDSKLLIAQCLLAFNSSATGSVADMPNSTIRFLNNTTVKNTATSGSVFNNNEGLISINSIVWGNTPTVNVFAQSATVNYSLVQDATQGDGSVVSGVANKDSLPRFVDFENNDFRLRSCSPAVDAGVNDSIIKILLTDIISKPRIVDGNGDGVVRVDMGAWEFDGNCAMYQCASKYDNCWIGCYNTNWHDATNWTAGIPTATQAVYIAGVDKTCYQPQVKANQTANVKTVDIDTDNQAIITIDASNNAVLKVND